MKDKQTAEEILKKHCSANNHHSDKTPELFTRWLIYDAMQEYATQQTSEMQKQLAAYEVIITNDTNTISSLISEKAEMQKEIDELKSELKEQFDSWTQSLKLHKERELKHKLEIEELLALNKRLIDQATRSNNECIVLQSDYNQLKQSADEMASMLKKVNSHSNANFTEIDNLLNKLKS